MFLRFFSVMMTFSIATSAMASDAQDFVEHASQHCNAFVKEGRADMSFALGKAAAKFNSSLMEQFNRQFAAKLVADYNMDASKGCVLDVVNMPPAEEKHSADRDVVVVAGVAYGKTEGVPVSVAYRLERSGSNPWMIMNVTLNGQPMTDRFREVFEAKAASGGTKAVLETL